MGDDFRNEATRMLRIARRDLKAAMGMLDVSTFDMAHWGYQVQQAAEKSLKAWISTLSHDYPFTHDLALLLRLVGDFGDDPSPYRDFEQFSVFATQLRYDDEVVMPELDRVAWNERCAALLHHVGQKLA